MERNIVKTVYPTPVHNDLLSDESKCFMAARREMQHRIMMIIATVKKINAPPIFSFYVKSDDQGEYYKT